MNEALNNNPKEFWKAVLGQIQLEISPMVYKTMVSRTTGVSFENDTLEVFCEDNFVKKNLETKFSSVVDNSVKNIGGKGIKIKYSVSKEKEVKENKDELGPLFSQQKTAEKLNEEKRIKSNLNPKFSFDNFILGKTTTLLTQ